MTHSPVLDKFLDLEPVQRVIDAVESGQQRAAGGLWGGSAALLTAGLAERLQRSILVITADQETATTLEGELGCFSDSQWLLLPEQQKAVDGTDEPISLGNRLTLLNAIAKQERHLVIAPLRALIQPVPRPGSLSQGRRRLHAGDRVSQEQLLEEAVEAGLRRVPIVLGPGEVSRRGDVLDLYGLGDPHALRLEFMDDELESLRRFDPSSQQSLGTLEEAYIFLGPANDERGHTIEHFLRPDLIVVRHEPLQIEEQHQQLALHAENGRLAFQFIRDSTSKLPQLDVSSLPSHDLDFKILSAGSGVGSGELDPLGRLRSIRGMRGEVHIFCRSNAERCRLTEIFEHRKISLASEHVMLDVGSLGRGFRVAKLDMTVISNVEFAGVPQTTRIREETNIPSKALKSFFELGPGDLVVHAAHGIAVFEEIELVERESSAEDHLRLCFSNDVRLLVPASKIHLVQKYVGAGDAKPRLDKLGGKGFARRKEEVQKALFDMAADLLDVQAQRETIRREPYPDDPLEREFLDAFPFTDTEDQQSSWAEIKSDLESPCPVDRLLCGDVGFGKTELAMRAAFKVAITGRQVAVLVPTTVLAEQHRKTFGDRFEPHGLRVDVLSRYRSPKDRTSILEDTIAGRIDLLIGTHRLLSNDVAFGNLGLVIVDEEQRFGVRHKERLKKLRLAVDVLTLSATPIPRTLHASLLGLRNISTLSTPPPGRQEVVTQVAFREPNLLRDALRRELRRQGQVFVLHNRVNTLDETARYIHELAPDARIAVGHGKMTASQMEKTIRRFVKGESDILICTTIIENGLDLPRANTMIIDRAERFGLAELHQLRGRVGRSDRQAYCYLILHREHPPGAGALRRLKVLEEFSHLGAGFAISMRDLEIRGAGNLLGPEQSGHIAAVGYDMYTKILRTTVEAVRSEHAVSHHIQEVDVDMRVQAYLPDTFLDDPKERLELLREMDGAVDPPAAERIRRSLRDRFGTPPKPVETLLRVFLLKHLLLDHGVLGVQFTGDDRIVVRHKPGQPLGGAWLDAYTDVRPVEAGKTHLLLPPHKAKKGPWGGEDVLRHTLQALLGGNG